MGTALEEMSAPARTYSEQAGIDERRLHRQVAQLPPLEQKVINWRYGLDGLHLTRREAAARLGVSTREVRSLERSGLTLLRLIAYAEAL